MNNNELKESYGLNTETDIDFCKIVNKIKNKDTILKGIKSKYILFKSNNNNYKEKWIYCCIEKLSSFSSIDYNELEILIIIDNMLKQFLILYDDDRDFVYKNCFLLYEKICDNIILITSNYIKNIYYEKCKCIEYDKTNEKKKIIIMKKILKILIHHILEFTRNNYYTIVIKNCIRCYNENKNKLVKELLNNEEYIYGKDIFFI